MAPFLVSPARLEAQASSNLSGRALDQQGAVLPGVSLTLKGEETGFTRELISNENGTFLFAGLAPGLYKITADLPGFKKYEASSLRLEIGKTAVVDITLQVGTTTDEVTVVAEAPLVDTTSKAVGGTVVFQELSELPSINRNFTTYMALMPGVVYNPNANFGADSVSIGGQATGQTLFMLDGAANNDDQRGGGSGSQARVPLEAIQEFQVLQGQFDAEYGGSGGVLNAVSKSGTNQLHGSAFALIRDSRLTEKEYFVRLNNLQKPKASEHQFGGTLGGPIVRDKAHFFGSLERVNLRSGITFNVPDRPDLNTTFSQPADVWNVFARFDHQINSKHTWGFRYLSEWSPQILYGNNRTAAAAQTEEDNDRVYTTTFDSVLSPKTLNSFKLSVVMENFVDASQAYKDNGYTTNSHNQEKLKPTLAFQNFTDQQLATANDTGNHTYSLNDDFSWFVPQFGGSHNFKFGVQGSYLSLKTFSQSNMNGTFSFSSSNKAFNPADPRTYPDRLTIRVPVQQKTFDRESYYATYFQDKWQPSPHLTLSFGVRYDVEFNSIAELNNPKFASPGDYPKDKNNFAPRTGFAYSLGNRKRSVIRGGWGLFYQRTQFGVTDRYFTSGVFADSFTVSFPANNIDSGPSNGRFPTDPMLAYVQANGLTVNRTLLNQLYPAGALQKNAGTVALDDPNRHRPYNNQLSLGFQQQLSASMALTVDFVRNLTRDLIILKDLNPGVRVDTSRTGTVNRVDKNFVTTVTSPVNLGWQNYNSLQMQLEKRFSHHYSFRTSYTLAKGRGNVAADNGTVNTQVLDDLKLNLNEGPTSVDRRHTLTSSGTLDIPHTGGLKFALTSKFNTGTAFTITDSSSDPDRNGILTDPIAAGTYTGAGPLGITVENVGGRNGAYGPNRYQLDGRITYRFKLGEKSALEAYSELLNITNYESFTNPSGDRRTASTFLVRTATSGVPRSIQFGSRFNF